MINVFFRFLWLGCVSFGGPIAHIAYFRRYFVEQHAWISEDEFMSKLSLCNVLPGPSSSQLGFAIGHYRAGYPGAFAAFIGFTLPSFLIMFGLAAVLLIPELWDLSAAKAQSMFGSSQVESTAMFSALLSGLKLAAVVIVIDALVGMFKSFCTNRFLVILALLTTLLLVQPFLSINPFLLMLLGAMVYGYFTTPASTEAVLIDHKKPAYARSSLLVLILGLFFALLIVGWFIVDLPSNASVFLDFFQVGATTFGGGHVVLPLLFEQFEGRVEQDVLLMAYSFAQAVPGPMFTVASFLGVDMVDHAAFTGVSPILVGSLAATLGIFLPGFLLLSAVLPHWKVLSANVRIAYYLTGVNAVVVGLLASALMVFVAPAAIIDWLDLSFLVLMLTLLKSTHLGNLLVLLMCVAYALTSALLGW